MGAAAAGYGWQMMAVGKDRRGRELGGSQHGPGSIYFAGHDITSERKKKIWSIRPKGTSAKNWGPL